MLFPSFQLTSLGVPVRAMFQHSKGNDGHTASDIGAYSSRLMTWASRLKYLFEKYRMAERGRAFPVHNSWISRGRVTAQSYKTNAVRGAVRTSIISSPNSRRAYYGDPTISSRLPMEGCIKCQR